MSNTERKPAAPLFKTRIGVLALALACCFALVLGRLFQLQVVRYERYIALSRRDNAAKKLLAASRAAILDRDGEVLAEDHPFLDLAVRLDRVNFERVSLDDARAARDPKASPEERKSRADLLRARLLSEPYVQKLASAISCERQELAGEFLKALDNVVRSPPWASASTAQTVARGIDEDKWLYLRALHDDAFRNSSLFFSRKELEKVPGLPHAPFPGLSCTVSTRRIYPHGAFACFVLGAVGELSEEDDAQLRQSGVLIEAPALRTAQWRKIRDAISPAQGAQLESLIQPDPREIDDAGQLYDVLARLSSDQKSAAARLGLEAPLKWTTHPPRINLNEPERLWLGVGMPLSGSLNALSNRCIGELGAERFYNERLRGKHGIQLFDADKRALEASAVPAKASADDPLKLGDKARPEDGRPLTLTLSSAWQQAVENALAAQPRPGAIVVLDCRNGEVLALASNPGFDPNLFTPPRNGSARQAQLKALFDDPAKPLLNRAISGEYPLGSIMKAVVAAAALDRGTLTTEDTFECPGFIKLGGQIFHCDGNHAHGTVNVYKGLRCSCNVMFHQVGANLGVEHLGIVGKLLLGKRMGIDLPAEASGVYPDLAWRMKTFPNNPQARVWTRGNDFQLAIGQGQMNATVLQAAAIMAALSNGGNVVTPHVWLDNPDAGTTPLGVGTRALEIVRRGLDECVNVGTPGERGTCYAPFHANGELAVRVAGKTSTAEHKKGAAPHAWFAGYAPADNPRIAFAVMLEEAGHGGAIAGPVAYQFLKEIYGTKSAPRNAAPSAERNREP